MDSWKLHAAALQENSQRRKWYAMRFREYQTIVDKQEELFSLCMREKGGYIQQTRKGFGRDGVKRAWEEHNQAFDVLTTGQSIDERVWPEQHTI
jgi:hypothetical protein